MLAAWIVTRALAPTVVEEPAPAEPVVAEPVVVEPLAAAPEPLPVVAPRLITFVQASRPPDSGTQSVAVLVSLDIDAQGRVQAVELVESGGDAFDAAAIAAVRQFEFEPAREGNTPIAVQIRYRYVFDELVPPVEPELPAEPEPLTIDDAEVVRGPRIDAQPAQLELAAAEAERLAGVQGDAIKAAQTLGGVGRPAAGQQGLVIWGMSPTDTRTYVDEIPMPRAFHLGGTRSILPSPMVDSVVLVPGGYGPAYGRSLGGYLDIRTRAPRSEDDPHRTGGYARLDTIDASLGVDTRVAERGAVSLGVRRSIARQTYGALIPDSSVPLVPLPDSWDYQTKSVVQVSSRDEIEILGFGAHDRVSRGIPSLTPDTRFSERRQAGFHRLALRVHRQHDSGRSVVFTGWAGLDDDQWSQQFDQVQADSSARAWRGGLRLREHRRLASFLVLRWGIDLEVDHTVSARSGAVTLPPHEGDLQVFGQPPGDRVGDDTWTTIRAGLGTYSSLRFELWSDRLTLEPGLRLEPMVVAGDRIMPVRPIEPEIGFTEVDVAVDPRLELGIAPAKGWSLRAAGGRYRRAPDPANLSPIFGNPRLAPAQALHAIVGVEGQVTPWLELVLTGVWLRAYDLSARANEPTPPVAQALVSAGDGRSYGGQATARIEPTAAVFTWLTYAWSRAERRDPGSTGWRPFDFDQTHVAQALAGWRHRSGVELGGRVSLASGNPRTPVVGIVANARHGGFDPIFGEQGSERLPLYFAASGRIAWARSFAWGDLRTWLDVQNLTSRRNAEEVFYSSDYGSRGYVTGLPILPSLGIEVRR